MIPGAAALGNGSPEAFVDGLHKTLIVAAVLAAIGAVASAKLIAVRRVGGSVEQLPAREPVTEAAA